MAGSLPAVVSVLLLFYQQAGADSEADHTVQPIRGPPHITSVGHDFSSPVVLGSTVTLSCESEGRDPATKLVWYKNGAKFDGSYGFGTTTAGKAAVVNEMSSRVTTRDISATYECHVEHSQLPTLVAHWQLDVVGPPLISGYEPGAPLSIGDVLTLTCLSMSGRSNLTKVTWYRDSDELPSSSYEYLPTRLTQELSIRVSAADELQTYTCRVSHPKLAQFLENDIDLTVIVPTVHRMTAHSTTEASCNVSPFIDFIFILDSSSSIKPPDFKKQKLFVHEFVQAFDVDAVAGTQFGAVQFGTHETLEFHLNTHKTKAEVTAALDHIHQTGVDTYLDRALRFMREQMLKPAKGSRPRARSAGIIVTDGDATDKDNAFREAKLLRSMGTELWAIGVGEVKKAELAAITANPDRTFYAANYQSLSSIIHTFLDAAKKECSDRVPVPQPTRPATLPGPPVVLEYTIGDPVILGEDYEIECLSPGGDSDTEVIWYKDDVAVDRTFRHEESGTFNHRRLRIDPNDGQAVYTCRVHHPRLVLPLNISFIYPIIGKPKIIGYETGNPVPVGSVVNLVCFTVSTDPKVRLTWYRSGVRLHEMSDEEEIGARFIGLPVVVTESDESNEYSCSLSHPKLVVPFVDSVHLTLKQSTTTVPEPPSTTIHPAPALLDDDCNVLNGPADVLLVIDSSNSIYEPDFAAVKEFLAQLITMFEPSRNQRVGAIIYGRFTKMLFKIGEYADIEHLQAALRSTRKVANGRVTDTAGALRYAREVMFKSPANESEARKVAIIVTDARSFEPEQTAFQAALARDSGILTVAVGVAVYSEDQRELMAIAGHASRILKTDNYDALSELIPQLPSAFKLCLDRSQDLALECGANGPPAKKPRPASCSSSLRRCSEGGNRQLPACQSQSRPRCFSKPTSAWKDNAQPVKQGVAAEVDWSEWEYSSHCNSTCGRGVQQVTRRCLNRPSCGAAVQQNTVACQLRPCVSAL